MKKIISLIMVVAMMCLALAACGTPAGTEGPTGTTQATVATLDPNLPAEEGFGLGGETPTEVKYFKTKELADGTVAITGTYTDAAELTKIVVPALVNGKKVSTIGESALASLAKLEEVVVSGYVTKIDAYAFRDCKAMAKITLPQYITTIAEGAFSGCKALTDTTFLPTSLQVLGARVFENCNFTKASIPDSVTSIGGYTFVGCAYLEEIKLPASLTAIPERMFMGCQKLKNTTGSENFVLPAGVKTIGDMAFYECYTIAIFEMPEALEKIGKQAFDTCRRLKEITIPANVKSIGDKAFNTCQNLATVTFAGDTELGKDLFTDSKKIATFNVKAGTATETYCNEWAAYVAGVDSYKVKPVVNAQ